MVRAGHALRGIFGDMLDPLLRRVDRAKVRGGSGGRGAPLPRAAAHQRALREALAYADDASKTTGRKPTMVAVAVDPRTRRSYRGASREAPGVPPELRSRLPDPALEDWPAANCAEVAAASRAVRDGSQLDDLIIVAVRRSRRADAIPEPPCRSCRTWVPGAAQGST